MNSNQSSNIAAVLNNTTNQNNISNGLSVTSNNSGNSTNSNYSASKLSGKAREAAEKLTQERKKATLVVVHQFLSENGFLSAARELANNIGFNLSSVSCADNIDLDSIFIEYEEYYTMKFGKKPKFFRKNDGSAQPYNYTRTGGEMEKEHKTSKPYSSSNPLLNKMRQRVAQQGTLPVTSGISSTNSNTKQPSRSNSATQKLSSTSSTNDRKQVLVKRSSTTKNTTVPRDAIDVSGKKLSTDDPPLGEDESSLQQQSDSDDDFFEDRILRPLPEEFYFGEMRELAEVIRRDILVSNPEVHWDDIAGLADAKQLIKEAVVIPLKYPELFNTIPVLSPWNGVLLFGPPGTGKTMLAKAVATECRTTFFNISASSIVSKWRGDSEKLVRILFELAEHYSPSTIFLDELDSIMSQRQSGSSGSEHEGSRRMKTELLIQMDGLSKRKGQVFVLAASNLPWDLDQAMLRRLEKRILVGLPDETSRKHIMEKLLAHDDYSSLSAADYEVLAKETTNYSGADLSLVCKESSGAMKKLRQVMFHIAQMERDNTTPTNLNPTLMLQKNKITLQDVQNALFSTKPSGGAYKAMYEEWQHKYGSNGAV